MGTPGPQSCTAPWRSPKTVEVRKWSWESTAREIKINKSNHAWFQAPVFKNKVCQWRSQNSSAVGLQRTYLIKKKKKLHPTQMHAEPVLHSPYGINHKYALLTRKNCPAVFYMQAGLAVVTTQMVQTAIISNSK